MTEPLLRVRDVKKTFPGVVALNGVQLEVGRGEVHALLGENGAGKSTMLKILSGAQPPDAGQGTLEFDGRPLDLGDTPLAAAGDRHRHDLPGVQPAAGHVGGREHVSSAASRCGTA